jgi:hypothetical protein
VVFEELDEPVKARKSKYHKTDIADGVKREKHDEASLILKGAIRKLKNDFGVLEQQKDKEK